ELNILEDKSADVEYKGVKEKMIFVEDDVDFGNKLREALEVYFDVDYYSDGKEAFEALELNGVNYQVLLTDLELLKEDKKLDQSIQGIELFEEASIKFPHIVKRIVSGLPRKGISELVNIDVNSVLYKSVIAYYGFSEGFISWIKQIKIDIKSHKDSKYMKGPNNAFWKDVEYSIDKKTGKQKASGSGFKRFYYELKKEDDKTFEAMWDRIYSRVVNILLDKPGAEKVETELIKTERGQGYLTKENREKSINFLETILTHRLIWLSYFNDGDEVIYKDINDLANSFYHKPFWKTKIVKGRETTLHHKPTSQFTFLSFSVNPIVPEKTNNTNEYTEYVKINFKYGDKSKQLFDKEERFLLENAELI
ncbi:MAG: response regulator transcription factor, partial [Ignavibacteriae bacterium]|nr:response regulator transcription factor [Ignavibacteriota bacterium]